MTTKPQKLVVDLAKGTQEYIDLTIDELFQMDQDAIAAERQRALDDATKDAALKAKASAEAKLTALGLTADEIAALSK
jgi:hypothetical protein